MLERCVYDASGSYVFMDTDSIAPVTDYRSLEPASASRGVNDRPDALSLQSVDAIVERFASLSPYDFGGSILEIEDENYAPDSSERRPLYARAVSAKRYVLFNTGGDDQPLIRKHSEHGLGTYRSPEGDGNEPLD